MQPRGGRRQRWEFWSSGRVLPPSSVEQFDFCQPLADHGGKEEGEQDAADQHVVVVVFQNVKLL